VHVFISSLVSSFRYERVTTIVKIYPKDAYARFNVVELIKYKAMQHIKNMECMIGHIVDAP
jgi:hypothetical protein